MHKRTIEGSEGEAETRGQHEGEEAEAGHGVVVLPSFGRLVFCLLCCCGLSFVSDPACVMIGGREDQSLFVRHFFCCRMVIGGDLVGEHCIDQAMEWDGQGVYHGRRPLPAEELCPKDSMCCQCLSLLPPKAKHVALVLLARLLAGRLLCLCGQQRILLARHLQVAATGARTRSLVDEPPASQHRVNTVSQQW